MAAITNLVARYSGTVTFTDKSIQYFHCQMDYMPNKDQLWAIDPVNSYDTQTKICWYNESGVGYSYWVRQLLAWRGLPFLSNAYIDTIDTVVTQKINGMALHGTFIFTLDNNRTYASSLVYDTRNGYQWISQGDFDASNKAAYIDRIELMLMQITNIADLTPA